MTKNRTQANINSCVLTAVTYLIVNRSSLRKPNILMLLIMLSIICNFMNYNKFRPYSIFRAGICSRELWRAPCRIMKAYWWIKIELERRIFRIKSNMVFWLSKMGRGRRRSVRTWRMLLNFSERLMRIIIINRTSYTSSINSWCPYPMQTLSSFSIHKEVKES